MNYVREIKLLDMILLGKSLNDTTPLKFEKEKKKKKKLLHVFGRGKF